MLIAVGLEHLILFKQSLEWVSLMRGEKKAVLFYLRSFYVFDPKTAYKNRRGHCDSVCGLPFWSLELRNLAEAIFFC